MRTVKDVQDFLNTKTNYPKWEGDTTGRFRKLETYFKLTDKQLQENYHFYLRFSSGQLLFVRITDFEFKTYRDSNYEDDYVYVRHNFSKEWQKFMAKRYADRGYAYNLKEYAEKNLKECKKEYNAKKRKFMSELKEEFNKEASPFIEMLDTANSILTADDKELD